MTRAVPRLNLSLIFLGAVATMSAMLAIPASASFDHHFTVAIGEARGKRVAEDKFRVKARLLDPRHRHERVGRLWAVRTELSPRKSHYRIHFHLSGRIGGFGKIRTKGNFGGGNRRFHVVGGNHDFNGVTGKVVPKERDLAHFDLRR